MSTSKPIVTAKTLELAAGAARAGTHVDLRGTTALAKAFRDLQANYAVNLSGGQLTALSESIALMGRRNAEAMSSALATINATNAGAVQKAFQDANLGAKWRAQVAETLQALNLSQAIKNQVAASMHEIAKVPRDDLAPRFIAAVAEAETYATLPEVQSVVQSADFETLTPAQRGLLQVAVLTAIAEVGTLVATFTGSRSDNVAAVMVGLLAALLMIHSALSE
jgi:hypothetical protein